MFTSFTTRWSSFSAKHPELTRFIMFFVFSNGVTLLQLALMPAFRWAFASFTDLVGVNFQALPVGANLDGSQYYMFDYAAGDLPAGGGGLAYFLSVQITLLIAQIINFFLQRNVTFKSNSSVWVAAIWYTLAYIVITFIAAAAQGFYKAPIYDLLMNTSGWGSTGAVVADIVTVIINSAISFWVFYPIFKLIFRQKQAEPIAQLGG